MDQYFNTEVIGILESDATLNIIRVNPGLCKMLGYTADELKHRTWPEITAPEHVLKMQDHFGPLFETGNSGQVLEICLLNKSGRRMSVAVTAQVSERDDKNAAKRFLSYIMDISRQKEAERITEAANRRTDDLYNKISRSLGEALKSKDTYTAEHQNHVARLADHIAVNLGLEEKERRLVAAAASVHDIGKTAVPAEYLAKTTPLEDLEWAVIQTHSMRGYEILQPLEGEFPVAEIVYQHHERLDGSGYPRGLSNGSILLNAQIVAAADTADSMINSRPYRRAFSKEATVAELHKMRGTHLREDVVDSCVVALEDLSQS